MIQYDTVCLAAQCIPPQLSHKLEAALVIHEDEGHILQDGSRSALVRTKAHFSPATLHACPLTSISLQKAWPTEVIRDNTKLLSPHDTFLTVPLVCVSRTILLLLLLIQLLALQLLVVIILCQNSIHPRVKNATVTARRQ